MSIFDEILFSNSFASLGEAFYSPCRPSPFASECDLVHFNRPLAARMGLGAQAEQHRDFIPLFSGQRAIEDSIPLAMLYAGHQFGFYVPELGDGRAMMLAEITNAQQQKWEIQLKGSGLTPYSRDGDGRAVLRSTIREYLCSAAMHGLNIPTTQALCMVRSDDEVYREKIEPGAMLTRVAPSHIRFGSFEVFYYRRQYDRVQQLADFVIRHHYPELQTESEPYLALLNTVIERTASLIAQWQAVGFAHGVMNSDNMSILGLTLDYGPFAFMESYHPGYICNHSDYDGRYAFDQQPDIGLFNLSCLAQALLPLLHEVKKQAADIAMQALSHYMRHYRLAYQQQMKRKLGLKQHRKEDTALVTSLLELMQQYQVDYTLLFRELCYFNPEQNPQALTAMFQHNEHFTQWLNRYQQRLSEENIPQQQRQKQMLKSNPKYILRNYLAEQAIRQAEEHRDYSEVDRLFNILSSPYNEQPEYEQYAAAAPEWAQHITLSCSS